MTKTPEEYEAKIAEIRDKLESLRSDYRRLDNIVNGVTTYVSQLDPKFKSIREHLERILRQK